MYAWLPKQKGPYWPSQLRQSQVFFAQKYPRCRGPFHPASLLGYLPVLYRRDTASELECLMTLERVRRFTWDTVQRAPKVRCMPCASLYVPKPCTGGELRIVWRHVYFTSSPLQRTRWSVPLPWNASLASVDSHGITCADLYMTGTWILDLYTIWFREYTAELLNLRNRFVEYLWLEYRELID